MSHYFVLGLDLDGVTADFYERMRVIVSEWTGEEIPADREPEWGLLNWGLKDGEYDRLHRYAVTQHRLFESLQPMPGAPQAIRRLGTEGIRIRIITHRLYIRYFHQVAVAQTVAWLDRHGVPYWDLCFMREKEAVGADLYIEDNPTNIQNLRSDGQEVIVFDNPTNRDVPDDPGGRAVGWVQAEQMIRDRYYEWLDNAGLERPPEPGIAPEWTRSHPKPET